MVSGRPKSTVLNFFASQIFSSKAARVVLSHFDSDRTLPHKIFTHQTFDIEKSLVGKSQGGEKF